MTPPPPPPPHFWDVQVAAKRCVDYSFILGLRLLTVERLTPAFLVRLRLSQIHSWFSQLLSFFLISYTAHSFFFSIPLIYSQGCCTAFFFPLEMVRSILSVFKKYARTPWNRRLHSCSSAGGPVAFLNLLQDSRTPPPHLLTLHGEGKILYRLMLI